MSASTRPQRQLKRSRGNVLSVTKRVYISLIALTVVEMTINFDALVWHKIYKVKISQKVILCVPSRGRCQRNIGIFKLSE